MASGGVDRLSELPNDILRRILHFAPLKEAASTTALWRSPLWLSSGAINIEAGVVPISGSEDLASATPRGRRRRRHRNARLFSRSEDVVSVAKAVLDAADDVPVTRLTLITWRPHYDHKELVEVLLSHRVTRHVEELLLVAKDPSHFSLCGVPVDSLPLDTLRILELTSCHGLLYDKEAVLPRLSSLRLSHSFQDLGSLQRVIDAAPALASVRLESVCIKHEETIEATWRHLRCPATTVLVLHNCNWEVKIQRHRGGWFFQKTIDRLKINATRLRCFSYKGPLRFYKFSPQPLELERGDLEFFEQGQGYREKDPNKDLETFWLFARNFTSTKKIRLKVDHLEDIAVLSEARQVELLPAFRHLECLEFEGAHWTNDKTAALATIMNLLHCCPALSALRINLTAKCEEEESSNKEEVRKRTTTRQEILTAAMAGPRYSFQCLQTSLRRVDLQFHLEKRDCFGVKLMKFFAENAMVLEEIRIDSGDEKLCEHMNPRVAKWNSSRRELGATSFVVLPLNAMSDATPASQIHVGGAGEMEKRCTKNTACRAKPPPTEEHASSSQKRKKKGGRKRETR